MYKYRVINILYYKNKLLYFKVHFHYVNYFYFILIFWSFCIWTQIKLFQCRNTGNCLFRDIKKVNSYLEFIENNCTAGYRNRKRREKMTRLREKKKLKEKQFKKLDFERVNGQYRWGLWKNVPIRFIFLYE